MKSLVLRRVLKLFDSKIKKKLWLEEMGLDQLFNDLHEEQGHHQLPAELATKETLSSKKKSKLKKESKLKRKRKQILLKLKVSIVKSN
jgi:hypothetical protein